MVSQTERAMGTVGFADPAVVDPTTSKPYTPEASRRQTEEIFRQGKTKEEVNRLQLPENIKKEVSEKLDLKVPTEEGILRPRARPEGLPTVYETLTPVDKVLELGYLLKEKQSGARGKTKIATGLDVSNPDHQKTIKGFFDNAVGGDTGYDPTKVAWCAAFVNHILTEMGADLIKSKDRYKRLRADEYKNYGKSVELEDIQEGDIVVFDWPDLETGKKDGIGDHVTFYAGGRIVDKGYGQYINVLGGNQQGGIVSVKENEENYTLDNVIAIRRITYDGDAYKIAQSHKNSDPVFKTFIPKKSKGYFDDPNSPSLFDLLIPSAEAGEAPSTFGGRNRGGLEVGYEKGGLSAQTKEAFKQPKKGLSYGELIIDNILGLDNEYESFGEKLGKAIDEDEINFLKNAAVGIYEGAKEFVTSPVETTKKVVTDIKDSVQRLGTEDLDTRLKNMYGISYNEATDEQVNKAKEAVFGDALTALELIPAAKGATAVAKAGSAAIPSGIKADVVGQTKALLSGDTEFLKGTPTERSATQSLSAGFTGQNPPTYLKRDRLLSEIDEYEGSVPTEKAELSTIGNMIFRDPIIEFAKTLNIPKKGLLGSEFLNQIRKNESTLETSLQEGIIDPSKRYTRDELLKVLGASPTTLSFTKPTFTTVANISPFRVKQFENYQRQKKVGFTGGTELDYFDIPVDTIIRKPGKKFKASSQHYNPETLLHVRGSIINPSGIDFDPDAPSYRREPTEFDYIIDDEDYLLVEEIQSDLITKGYVKPKNYFDAVFNEATENWSVANTVTYREAFGDIDKEIKKIIKFLDHPASGHLAPGRVSKNPKFYKPGSNLTNFSDDVKVDITEGFITQAYGQGFTSVEEISNILLTIDANKNDIDDLFKDLQAYRSPVDGRRMVVDGSFLKEKDDDLLDDIAALDDQDDDIVDLDFIFSPEDVKNPVELDEKGVKEAFLNYHNSRKQKAEDATNEYLNVLQYKINELKIDKEIDVLDLAEIHENYLSSQAFIPDTSDIGLPPIRKNKQAVDEALKVFIAKAAQQGVNKIVIPPAEKIAEARGRVLRKDKGDRFYRTYVTDLNRSLEELKANYPVTVYKDVELPYKKGIKVTEPLGDELLPPSQRKKSVGIDNKGTIIDISKLTDEYKVEKPRQFAEGGTVDMNRQMEMAFMREGGLRDDGMDIDPVSGNEVPPGSMAKEVRDDIPARLSEGEYVVPADVVQYYGVKFFEDLRADAKIGLQEMERNGRIGGEPVDDDLSNEEMMEIQTMMQGGMVQSEQPSDPYFQQNMMYQQPIGMSNGGYSAPVIPNIGTGFSWETSGPGSTTPTVPVETPETCAARGMVYNPQTKMCEAPTDTKVKPVSDSDKGPFDPVETPDPIAWSRGITDPVSWAKENSTSSLPGFLGALGTLGNLAKIEAMAIIAKENKDEKTQKELEAIVEQTIKENPWVEIVPESLRNGTQIANNIRNDTKSTSYINNIYARPAFEKKQERRRAEVEANKEAQAKIDKKAAAKALKAAQKANKNEGEFNVTNVSIGRDLSGMGTMSTTYGSGSNATTFSATADDIGASTPSKGLGGMYGEGYTADVNKGGLMKRKRNNPY